MSFEDTQTQRIFVIVLVLYRGRSRTRLKMRDAKYLQPYARAAVLRKA